MNTPGMNPDERDRLARLETRFDSMEDWVRSMDGKLDRLLRAADMGKGAWWAILKLGGILTVLAGAGAWIWDHLGRGP